jgi:hypothetical protein
MIDEVFDGSFDPDRRLPPLLTLSSRSDGSPLLYPRSSRQTCEQLIRRTPPLT